MIHVLRGEEWARCEHHQHTAVEPNRVGERTSERLHSTAHHSGERNATKRNVRRVSVLCATVWFPPIEAWPTRGLEEMRIRTGRRALKPAAGQSSPGQGLLRIVPSVGSSDPTSSALPNTVLLD